MVSDRQVDSNHRKHRRSSSPSDEVVKSSKRHKHRHHKHHRRHHRDKKHDEEEFQYGDGETAVAIVLSPTSGDPTGVRNGGELNMEEGEVLVEERIREISMKKFESDGESGERKSGQLCDNNLPVSVDTLPDLGLANDRDFGKHAQQPKGGTSHCGSTRELKRDAGCPSKKISKTSYEDDRSSLDREGTIKEKEHKGSKHRDRDLRKEREWEKRKEVEADRGRRNERGSIDKDRRDRDYDRGRSRDKARYSSRERERGNERERRSEKDRDKGREFQSDREKHKILDDGYGEVRHEQSGYSRQYAEDDLDIRSSNSIEGHNTKGGDFKETRGNVERSGNDYDDNGEVVWEVANEEEDALKRIEESRKRMQAIMEKYKKNSEQQNVISSHDKGKDLELADIPKQSSTVADVLGSGTLGHVASAVIQAKAGLDIDAVAGEVTKLSSAVGEAPAQLVISASDRTPASAGLGEGSPKSERLENMFSDDIFGESPAGNIKMGYLQGNGTSLPIVRRGLHDNWDDAEGYYSYQFGELLDGRYEIMSTQGKGVFSNVVRAKDTKAELAEPEEVAIKIIRNNETMHKAGRTEVQILKKLAGSDPENKRHCVRFLSTFKYRNHLCLVFESLHLNLREHLKKFGRNIGLPITDVRVYAKQLFTSLKHLKNCGVLHCDIKPDNMLLNEGSNVLKLCDFGSAMFAGENQVTPYLVSRFYRAPEIILGLSYDHPLDIWSVGCCLYELYSGKIMFPGSTNNDMLRLHMELKGPFPKKMLRKGAFIDQHFDQDLSFYATEEDSVTGKTIRRMMVNIKAKDFGSVIKGHLKYKEDPKVLLHFRDLLDKIFILDPQKRLTVSQALAHPFITAK